MTKRPLTISGLARELRLDRRTIRRYTADLPPAGRDARGFSTWKSADVAEAIAAKRETSGNSGRLRELILAEKVRGLRWQNDKRAAELVSLDWLRARMGLVLDDLGKATAEAVATTGIAFARLGIPASASAPITRRSLGDALDQMRSFADELDRMAARAASVTAVTPTCGKTW